MVQGRTVCYLISVRGLTREALGETAWQQALGLLDEERLGKLQRQKLPDRQAQMLGAGLLLQYGVQEWCRGCDGGKGGELRRLAPKEILDRVAAPCFLQYSYGEKGKPYFAEAFLAGGFPQGVPPLYFNLSHSGEYVLCGFSNRELGVDIQEKRPLVRTSLAERFFSKREQELFRECKTQEERANLLYYLWTRKEAYGKLTGEGIAAAVGADVGEALGGIVWEAYEAPEGYSIAVCRKGCS